MDYRFPVLQTENFSNHYEVYYFIFHISFFHFYFGDISMKLNCSNHVFCGKATINLFHSFIKINKRTEKTGKIVT